MPGGRDALAAFSMGLYTTAGMHGALDAAFNGRLYPHGSKPASTVQGRVVSCRASATRVHHGDRFGVWGKWQFGENLQNPAIGLRVSQCSDLKALGTS